MINLESTFTNWTKPSSDTEQAKCDNALAMVKKAINIDKELSNMKIKIFAQGSYANNTNVRLNSDVDICVCYLDAFFPHYPEGTSQSDFNHINSKYDYFMFKNQVEAALVNYFGRNEIKRGKKALDIKSNTYRVDADVVPCFEHRRYQDKWNQDNYLSGISFRTDENKVITSWPEQHIAAGIKKNNNTNTQFKKVTRILKRLNLEMLDKKIEISAKIPSFLIECLVWNTPNEIFRSNTYSEIIDNTLIHLHNSTKNYGTVEEWGEVSELKYLFKGDNPWTYKDINNWVNNAWGYIHT